MIDLSTLQMALRALARNKMRSGLTMLGIIIGVAAVIVMVAIGEGAKYAVQNQIASMGSNLLVVFPGTTTQGGVRHGWGSMSTMTIDDVEAIARECPAVRMSAPGVRSVAQAVSQSQNWSTSLQGTTPEYFEIRNWPFRSGESFGYGDVAAMANVCVLGATAADKLFGSEDPVGLVVRIKNLPFRVAGVLEPKGQSVMGSDQDDTIVIPYTTLQRKVLGISHLNMIFVSAVSQSDTAVASEQVTSLLRQRHRIQLYQEDDFSIRNLSDVASTAAATSSVMTLLLASIAGVSLLVGGIGVMNIMLVSVTERTREIGIRMAVGALAREIMGQFLVESVVLALLGGSIGILVGIGGARAISAMAKWPTLISPASIALAFAFSAAVGIFFGLYPARKASQLDPIDSLRYE